MPLQYFTLIWKIENFSYYWRKFGRVQILSPVFDVNFDVTTKWRLEFSDRCDFCIQRKDRHVEPFLHRIDQNSADAGTLNIEISFVKDDKSLVRWFEKKVVICKYQKYYIGVRGSELPFLKLKEICPQDILIIRCKICKNEGPLNLLAGQCFANTLLALEFISSIAVVENFNKLMLGLIETTQIKLLSFEHPILTINVCLSDERNLFISVDVKSNYIYLYFGKVLVLDNSGNWQECGQDREWRKFGEVCEFPLNVDVKTLINKKKYLQNGTLTLKCEVLYSTKEEPRRVETIKYGLSSYETCQQISPCVTSAQETKKASLKSPSTLPNDLIALYKEGTLCDVKLRTKTETFPAHKAVLSSRSPVFKKMFTTDMKEKTSDCVDISDLNAENVRQLLVFIYTDAIENMDWQIAKDLYFAADKYDIVSLKLKCSTFLKLNIRQTNCCELLLLSDMHQDADLKGFVQDYMVTRDQDVFGSDEWRNFVKNHVQLAADTMCLKYSRK